MCANQLTKLLELSCRLHLNRIKFAMILRKLSILTPRAFPLYGNFIPPLSLSFARTFDENLNVDPERNPIFAECSTWPVKIQMKLFQRNQSEVRKAKLPL